MIPYYEGLLLGKTHRGQYLVCRRMFNYIIAEVCCSKRWCEDRTLMYRSNNTFQKRVCIKKSSYVAALYYDFYYLTPNADASIISGSYHGSIWRMIVDWYHDAVVRFQLFNQLGVEYIPYINMTILRTTDSVCICVVKCRVDFILLMLMSFESSYAKKLDIHYAAFLIQQGQNYTYSFNSVPFDLSINRIVSSNVLTRIQFPSCDNVADVIAAERRTSY